MKLGFSPYSYPGSIYPFDGIFSDAVRLDYTRPQKCDAILLWGGTDINPKYYNEEPDYRNQYQADSKRDQDEWAWMLEAKASSVPIIGICRGAQFLCAFAGGKLIQHMTGHHGSQLIYTPDGREFMAKEDHHQAMLPVDCEASWIATAKDGIPEVVYFPKIRGLAIQGHPEWEQPDAPVVEFYCSLVESLLKGELQ